MGCTKRHTGCHIAVKNDTGINTQLAELGRNPAWTHGVVNPPVYHASTCVFETLAEYDAAKANPDAGLYYGRLGTPTVWALETALNALEPSAAGTKITPSGVAAISVALLSVLKSGDHLLVMDSAYEPTRSLANGLLKQLGIETSYYDPLLGADVAAQFKPNTRAIMVESPGSLTFEVQDVPAIAAVAHAHGAVVIMDNTWATPLYFKALDHGVDISIMSLTKYVVGHSDALLGSVTANAATWPQIKNAHRQLGQCAGPDDLFLALRGLRTLSVRLERHNRSACDIALWLQAEPQVERVFHPALSSCPGHALWQRDFTGSTGLFSILLKPGNRAQLAAMVDGLKHYKMGFSWGGFESLVLPVDPKALRTATSWTEPGQLLRLHIGLEDVDDLKADLSAGLMRYADLS